MDHKISKIRFVVLIILLVLIVSCNNLHHSANKYTILNIDFGECGTNRFINILFKDSTYRVLLDSNGVSKINIPEEFGPGYGTIYGLQEIRSFYLEPKEDLSLYRDKNGKYSFTGSLATINNYLNNHEISGLDLNYELCEKDFIDEWKKLPNNIELFFDTLSLPSNFVEIEKERMRFLVINMLLDYPIYYYRIKGVNAPLSIYYYNTIEEVMQEDSTLSDLWEYRQAFKKWLLLLADKNSLDNKPINKLKCQLSYLESSIKSSLLAEYLTHSFILDYVRYNGITGVEEILPFYNLKVTDPKKVSEFKKMYSEYLMLEKGQPAPDFNFIGFNRKKYQLADFIGKYLYIDVWATWCGPCNKELLSLKKLEKEFEGRNINFVSISIDENIKEWEKRVEKDKLKGFVLHIGNDTTFRENYKIDLIPRFILIDPQGKIINAKMTRPSESRTIQMLKSLPGI